MMLIVFPQSLTPSKTKFWKNEGVDVGNEVVDADNEVLDNDGRVTVNADALPPERKGYRLHNPPNISYNDYGSN